MAISSKIKEKSSNSSMIRRMFEIGFELKEKYGKDKVCDFTLGNPDQEPPAAFKQAIREVAASDSPGMHSYMPNMGLKETRKSVADHLNTVHPVTLDADDIVMTCGAAGGMNIIFKSILEPGDEVICSAPYFPEYQFYVDNFGGKLKLIPCLDDFNPDLRAIDFAITERTKAVIINSPNNPTGKIYPESMIRQIGAMLSRQSHHYGKEIYLISDEPYRNIVFDNVEIPSVFKHYPESFVVTSYSKDLSIPGERIGYVAVHPRMTDKKDVLGALALVNRTLGYINAPVFMQRAIARVQGVSVDASIYERRRNILCAGLEEAGYDVIPNEGAFYLFVKSPISDDKTFVSMLQEELVLAVPGSGFGLPGYFRISYAVDDQTVERSIPGFKRAIEKLTVRELVEA